MSQQLLIGDGNASDDSLYKIPVSISAAEDIAYKMAAFCGIRASFEVVRGRYARLKHGGIKRVVLRDYLITLNKPSVGAVLHEMAHIGNDGEPIDGWNHTPKFRHQLKRLTIAYHKYYGD